MAQLTYVGTFLLMKPTLTDELRGAATKRTCVAEGRHGRLVLLRGLVQRGNRRVAEQ